MTVLTAAELLDARQQAHDAALANYLEQAREKAARHGLSLTCQDKPLGQHSTCIGLNAVRGGGRINNGLGCLCECHDEQLREATPE